MKKILIITALFLSTGLTALSITLDNKKAEEPIKQTTVAEKAEALTTGAALGTAD